nr:ficolin-2-like [Pelodiscus sinensis]|eukprot:XP_025044870.1 ficolin-2-like [Pelodiscus sinensis]
MEDSPANIPGGPWNQGVNELRVDLTDFENNHGFAKYSSFKILGETENYKLILGSFLLGTSGDSLTGHNNMLFSTKDRQQDPGSNKCATTYKGAWWYSSCHTSNLNGMYWLGAHSSFADGVNWHTGKGLLLFAGPSIPVACKLTLPASRGVSRFSNGCTGCGETELWTTRYENTWTPSQCLLCIADHLENKIKISL